MKAAVDFSAWLDSVQEDRAIGLVVVLIACCLLALVLHVLPKVIA